jgi:hypothetical protein
VVHEHGGFIVLVYLPVSGKQQWGAQLHSTYTKSEKVTDYQFLILPGRQPKMNTMSQEHKPLLRLRESASLSSVL